MYAAANQGIQHILRDEWNYGGYIIDDALTASEYSSAPEMLMAGNNIFCLDTARPNEIEKLITSTDDEMCIRDRAARSRVPSMSE